MDGARAPVVPRRRPQTYRRRRSARLRRALLPFAALVGLVWWWRHPAVLISNAGYVEVNDVPGTTALVGMTAGDLGEEAPTVLLRSARPRMARPVPAGVTVDVWVCRSPLTGQPVFSARGSIESRCARAERVHGAVLNLADRTEDQLVLVVRSNGPHRIALEGLDVSYSAGWQRGDQTVGPSVVVDFSGNGQSDAIGLS